MKTMINIPRRLTHGDDLVVIRKSDYDALKQQIGEFKETVGKIKRGEKEFQNGKTKIVRSLADLR